MRKRFVYGLMQLIFLMVYCISPFRFVSAETDLLPTNSDSIITKDELYTAATLDPAAFTTSITNPFFGLAGREVGLYEVVTAEGVQKTDVALSAQTNVVSGVLTAVYFEKVWLNEVLTKVVLHYVAQDRPGNVWYFGRDVSNYVDGELVDDQGSWLAGKNGASQVIWIAANPQPALPVGEMPKIREVAIEEMTVIERPCDCYY